MGAKQGCIESQPALEQQNTLLEQVVFADQLREGLDEIESEESTKLPDADVYGCASNFEFYHQWVGLVDEVDTREGQRWEILRR